MSNPKLPLEELPPPADDVATPGTSKMGARRSSVKNLIKLFQPVPQEEKLARLSGATVESSATSKAIPIVSRNLNGSVRYVWKQARNLLVICQSDFVSASGHFDLLSKAIIILTIFFRSLQCEGSSKHIYSSQRRVRVRKQVKNYCQTCPSIFLHTI
jgi:hypothetical protein